MNLTPPSTLHRGVSFFIAHREALYIQSIKKIKKTKLV
jgi:hypothetical protein